MIPTAELEKATEILEEISQSDRLRAVNRETFGDFELKIGEMIERLSESPISDLSNKKKNRAVVAFLGKVGAMQNDLGLKLTQENDAKLGFLWRVTIFAAEPVMRSEIEKKQSFWPFFLIFGAGIGVGAGGLLVLASNFFKF